MKTLQPVTIEAAGFRLGVVLLLLADVGCTNFSAQYDAIEAPEGGPRQVELVTTSFYPQAAYQCGPAALAILLEASGVQGVDPENIAAQIYAPGLRGSLQAEVLGAARRADRVPYVLEPRFGDLLNEVRAGHPVLVLQNLGLSFLPRWHYAVVIGFDMDAGEIILRSGKNERQVTSFRRFERTWRLADHWALVIPAPGQLPATASALRYVAAVAVLEKQRRWQAAITAYEAARARWPDFPMSHLGLGNIAYQRARYERAVEHFQAVIRLAPDEPAAHYNLAWTYLRQGKAREALASARQAQLLAPDHPRYAQSAMAIAEAAKSERSPIGKGRADP